MKCEYCNNEIQPGAATCPACGAPAPAAVVTPAAAAYPAPQPVPVAAPVYAAPAQPSVVVVNTAPQAPAQPVQATFSYPYPPKSRLTYIILAIFLGWLGVHNFYAKRTGCGITQLLITVLSFGFFAVISELWCLIEILAVDKDGNNIPFK
jgi:TM2 domain-containing membrane protein YozV